jgi:predicted aldo/keto reductase-like oxidoreductase
MPYRMLGKTGERLSVIGLGGAHIGSPPDEAEMIKLMRTAVDGGITFFDNAWAYNHGESDRRMGKALKDGYRQKVFLMTKTDSHTVKGFNAQLEESLQRMQVEMIDLVQFHEVIRKDDPEQIFAPGGAIEAAMAARKAGKIRYIGFTGHKDPTFHLHMLDVADQHRFHFDSIQFPVNVMDAHFKSFQHQVIPVATSKGIGVLTMKTFGSGAILRAKVAEPMEILRYSMSQAVTTVIVGMDSMPRLEQSLAAAKNFKPMAPQEVTELLARTKDAAMDGQYEQFKVSTRFDGTVHNPEYLA